MSVRDLLIVGAGPSGLAAAIAAKQLGLDYQVLEQGVLVNSIFRFPPQMVFFTTPELLEIGGLPFVSPYDKPTRAEALVLPEGRRYLRPADRVRGDRSCRSWPSDDVRAGVRGRDAIVERVRRVRPARHVVFRSATTIIRTCSVSRGKICRTSALLWRPHRHYRQRVVIVGGGNSAAEGRWSCIAPACT